MRWLARDSLEGPQYLRWCCSESRVQSFRIDIGVVLFRPGVDHVLEVEFLLHEVRAIGNPGRVDQVAIQMEDVLVLQALRLMPSHETGRALARKHCLCIRHHLSEFLPS